MIKVLMAVSCLMLSMAVNAATINWTFDDSSALTGGFTAVDGLVTEADVTVTYFGTTRFTEVSNINTSHVLLRTTGRSLEILSPTSSWNGSAPHDVDYTFSDSSGYVTGGVAYITPSQVPIPAAAWLFGSALLGLGVVKRKKA